MNVHEGKLKDDFSKIRGPGSGNFNLNNRCRSTTGCTFYLLKTYDAGFIRVSDGSLEFWLVMTWNLGLNLDAFWMMSSVKILFSHGGLVIDRMGP